jgi:hypothetical protein
MRVLLKISIPMEVGNAGIIDGTLPQKIKSILDEQKPEAAFFIEEHGKRTGIVVVNLKDESSIPAVSEPWFLAFNATVEMHPAMVPEDLMKAGPAIEHAVKKYGQVAQPVGR